MRHANPGSNQPALPSHSLPISLLAMLHLATLVVLGLAGSASHADVDLTSKFTNQSTIGNTRHNLTQRQTAGSGPTGSIMDVYRNDYMEICVYCHTPHAANTTAGAPLWNRALPSSTAYTVYSSNSMSQTPSQPGAASLVCLSCHDGQQAMDAIMNMPGSGRYNPTPNDGSPTSTTFLNAWNNSRGPDALVHAGLNPNFALGCLACHSSGAGVVGAGAADFTVALIGTDLRDDHPVGVRLPTGTDWKTPVSNAAGTKFFDEDSDNRIDKGEIRLYGANATVECGSCHDPHGVTSGTSFNATFLRKPNAGSAVCLTCHSK